MSRPSFLDFSSPYCFSSFQSACPTTVAFCKFPPAFTPSRALQSSFRIRSRLTRQSSPLTACFFSLTCLHILCILHLLPPQTLHFRQTVLFAPTIRLPFTVCFRPTFILPIIRFPKPSALTRQCSPHQPIPSRPDCPASKQMGSCNTLTTNNLQNTIRHIEHTVFITP